MRSYRETLKRCNLTKYTAHQASAANQVNRGSRCCVGGRGHRQIEERDLSALDCLVRIGPCSRRWNGTIIVEEEVERDLRTLVKQLNAGWSSVKGITVPTAYPEWPA
jgi:hypothetical protein